MIVHRLLQVTIIIYLSVVGSLLLYMLFLLLVDPLIRRQDPYIQPLQNEDDSEVRAPQSCSSITDNHSVHLLI